MTAAVVVFFLPVPVGVTASDRCRSWFERRRAGRQTCQGQFEKFSNFPPSHLREREGGQLLLGGRWSQRDEMGHPARHTGHCLPPAQDGRLFALFFSTEETGGRCRPVALPLTGPWPPPKQGAERPGGGHDHRSLPSSSSAYISSQKKRNFTPLVFLSWGGFRFLTGRSLVEGKCLLFNYGMKKR